MDFTILKNAMAIILLTYGFHSADCNNCGVCDPSENGPGLHRQDAIATPMSNADNHFVIQVNALTFYGRQLRYKGSNCWAPCQSVTATLDMLQHVIDFMRELSKISERNSCMGTNSTTPKPTTTKKPTLTTMYPRGSTTRKPNLMTTEEPFTTTEGTVAVPCDKGSVDVVILLDTSGSIKKDNFTIAKTFVANLSRALVSTGNNRLGIIYYSDNATLYIPLVNPLTPDAMFQAIMRIPYDELGTNIGKAMTMGLGELRRYPIPPDTVSQNMIVITDGESQDDVRTPADRAKADGVNTFAIGIGGSLSQHGLLVITGGNETRICRTDFANLNGILRAVTSNLCK